MVVQGTAGAAIGVVSSTAIRITGGWGVTGVGICVLSGLVAVDWGITGVGVCVLGGLVAIGWGIAEGISTEECPIRCSSRVPCVLKYSIHLDLISVLNFFLSMFIFSLVHSV